MGSLDDKLELHAGGCGRYFDKECDCMTAAAKAELQALRTALASATARSEELERAVVAGFEAADELMTEFCSKRRAADWGKINHGMYLMERIVNRLTPAARAALAETRKEGK